MFHPNELELSDDPGLFPPRFTTREEYWFTWSPDDIDRWRTLRHELGREVRVQWPRTSTAS